MVIGPAIVGLYYKIPPGRGRNRRRYTGDATPIKSEVPDGEDGDQRDRKFLTDLGIQKDCVNQIMTQYGKALSKLQNQIQNQKAMIEQLRNELLLNDGDIDKP